MCSGDHLESFDTMTRKLQLLMGILMITGLLAPLNGQSTLKKAKKQFELKAYELAVFNYQQVLNENPDHVEAMISLGQCHMAMNNNLQAVSYFEMAFDRVSLSPNDLLSYGKVLMKLAAYDRAKDVFLDLVDENPVTAEHYIESCNYAKRSLKLPIAYQVSTFGGNTESSDFGITAYKDKWAYTSFRNDIKDKDKYSVPGTRLFSTGNIASHEVSISLLRPPLRSSYQLGPISYASDYSTAAIMKNNFKEGYLPVFEGDEDQSILLAEVDADGDFYNEVPFKYNEVGSSTAFPCLAFNGSALYFSSNREGGYGGFDLYVSYKIDGEWTTPENLGPQINTRGNEITPYFNDHTLYFSSDYHHGIGGYDVFKSVVYNGDWSFPENMGNGVNSPGDDLYPYVEMNSEKIYISSNRLGSKGNLDLYAVKRIEEESLAKGMIDTEVPLVSLVSDEGFVVTTMDEEPPNTDKEDEFSREEEEELIATANSDEASTDNSDITQKPEALDLSNLKVAPSTKPDWVGAKMVGFDESLWNGNKVYFIQLAALSKTQGREKDFQRLTKFGNIYRIPSSKVVKIKLGYFLDKNEASKVLDSVKSYGFADAFITHQKMNTAEMELMLSNDNLKGEGDNSSYMVPSKFKGTSNYKVRLASYEDPIWFDINKAKDLGKIEQWTKSGWTIFILSGFSSKEDAEKARIRAVNKGFSDAEIVYDNNGILERLKKN